MSRPTWGSAGVTGLAGFATGLLVAALLIAGRPTPRPAEVIESPPATSRAAAPITVTAPAAVPPPATVTSVEISPAVTTTDVVSVTVLPTPSTTSTTPTTSTPPVLTSGRRD